MRDAVLVFVHALEHQFPEALAIIRDRYDLSLINIIFDRKFVGVVLLKRTEDIVRIETPRGIRYLVLHFCFIRFATAIRKSLYR